ncbi:DHA2 family efflux MFS transporter permease subunit [Paenibacillus sp. DXFW5]|uniref:DHA2 family efflux MFS transporter permease subunit n=1 Tax=Paenibacillus rhizolycopersici TaxID=2780073 RepID=A0ABS2H2X5_9BACL|nr:DHA2 family efflux MFS transporter permease subunit [Paenibacillus rhizolycopersici]MBM6995146.1 DHA2 family efflux MFS transporter permease subunit [Paenibacillus rhizolycopersici]
MNHEAAVQDANFKRWPIVMALLIGAFVSILNQTLMNVALPQMMDDLGVGATTIQWLSTGFMLVNGVLIPISAFLMERFTTRMLFISAMILFSAGTFICGIGSSFELVLAGRLVQAAGAGVLMPLMTVVFLTIFPIEKRGQAMGMMGIAMIFAPAVGPTLSGWVIEHHPWNVLFWIIFPFAILSIFLGFIFMKNVTQVGRPKLDVLSIILSTIGFGGVLYGFSEAGSTSWGETEVVVSLIVGVVSLGVFLWRQMRSDKPLLEFRVFRYDMFSLTTIINVVVTMAMYAAMILLPIYLQKIRGFSPLESGLLLMPGAILMGIMSPITGMIFDRIGARWLAVVGLGITAVTTWEFSNLTDSTTYTHLILMYTARMFGMSMLMMPIQTAGLNQLPARLNAHGTAMSNTLRTIAGALGTALLVTIMSSRAKEKATEMILTAGINPKDPSNAQQVALITRDATINGIDFAFVVATGITLVAFVLAFFIRKVQVNIEGQDSENEENGMKPAKA